MIGSSVLDSVSMTLIVEEAAAADTSADGGDTSSSIYCSIDWYNYDGYEDSYSVEVG
jgi:hypothetical protein